MLNYLIIYYNSMNSSNYISQYYVRLCSHICFSTNKTIMLLNVGDIHFITVVTKHIFTRINKSSSIQFLNLKFLLRSSNICLS